MKHYLKRFGSVVLILVLIMSLSVTALAEGEASLTGGEIGGFTEPDTPTTQSKVLILKKELTAFNLDEPEIVAPTISYTYAIEAGPAGVNVMDAATDHAQGVGALTVPTKAGITTGITMTGTAANTIAWTNDDTLTASTDGTANYKDLKIDFSNVVFTGPGVYRYKITETPSGYAAAGVTETKSGEAAGSHVRYLDVYVKPATTFTTGAAASDWDIYGYVCMYESEEITPEGDTTTTGAMKTNGFVSGTNDGTVIKADSYYTFNVIVGKTVVNDAYAKATHAFPFTVIFTNATVSQSIDISSKPVEANTSVSGFVNPAAAALSEGTTKGIVYIKDGATVKYIGIPNGTSVEVYETNDVTGVIYHVVTNLTTTTTVATPDASVTWGTAPTAAEAQAATKAAYESTKSTITTTADADDDNAYKVDVTNTLLTISPTGITLRVAPYALMLCVGLLLLVYSRKRKAKAED